MSGPAVKPGASGDSLLIRRVTAVAARMPLGQPALTDGEIGVLRHWIDEGAAGLLAVKWPSRRSIRA